MKRGDVFSLSLRGNAGKARPGIVVHASEMLYPGQPVLVCPLTSDLLAEVVTRPTINPSAANGLLLPSQVMVNRMTSAEPNQLRSMIGALADEDVGRVDLALMVVLGLTHRLTGQA